MTRAVVQSVPHIGGGFDGPAIAARIDAALARALDRAEAGRRRDGSPEWSPPGLARAIRYAAMPGGARIRPAILLAVSLSCGEDRPAITDGAAAALELIHCASLVHDDLPCFDNADIRRGKPSVHRAFSEPLAVLTGDALIVTAFDTLAEAAAENTARGVALVRLLARHSGTPGGICAGQGWESEPRPDVAAYHRAKTAALFVAATEMGAVAAGQEPAPWSEFGERIGEAYQVADDLRDVVSDVATTGKTAGQDRRHRRPNAVAECGAEAALSRLSEILAQAASAIPPSPGRVMLEDFMQRQASKVIAEIANKVGNRLRT